MKEVPTPKQAEEAIKTITNMGQVIRSRSMSRTTYCGPVSNEQMIKDRQKLKALGSAIRCLRLYRGLRQYPLSRKAGVSHSYICAIEKFRSWPSPRVYNALCSALDVGTVLEIN